MSYVYTKEVKISLGNIRDHVAPLLYATGTLKDNEELVGDIDLGKAVWEEEEWVVPVTLNIQKTLEVRSYKLDE